MLRTRQEIAALLKKAEGNLQKTQKIHVQLQSLVVYIEEVLSQKRAPKRKALK